MKIKDDLPIEQAVVKYMFPMLEVAERMGRFDIIEGAFLGLVAMCEVSDDEAMDIYMKVSASINNKAVNSNRGLPEIMAASGYDVDKVKEIVEKLKEAQRINGVQ